MPAPTVRIAPDARQQFFDNQGNILSGGKLFTYLAGSSTKKNTYTDSTGNTANANPIVLSTSGRTPNGLWLEEGVSYKLVLCPANDTDPPTSPIWSEDNVVGIDDATALNTFIANLANSSDAAKGAALVGFLQAGAGAVGRTALSKMRDIISVKDFGAAGNGSTDDTAAFQAWAARIVALGGGIGLIPPGTYNVTVPKTGSAVMMDFLTVQGFTLIAGGAVIADQQTYAGTESGIMFQLREVIDFAMIGRPKITSQVCVPNLRGMVAFQAASHSNGLHFDFEQVGGLGGIRFYRASGDPVADRAYGYTINAKFTSVYYPVNGQFSGDNGTIDIDCFGCGRNYFYYGASHLDIRCRSKNQFVSSILGTADGYGVIDAKIRYYDRDSDTSSGSAPPLSFTFGDSTPAIIKDIDVHIDIKNPAGSPWSTSIAFDKLALGAPDTVGRGHRLENFCVSGISEQAGTNAHFGRVTNFLFAAAPTPDVVKNLKVRDFIGTGATVDDDWIGLLSVLADRMTFENVNYDSPLKAENGANGRVVFKDCKATAFNANRGGSLTYGDTGAAMVLIDSVTANASAAMTFTKGISADYASYLFRFYDLVPAVDAGFLYLEVSEDGGGTWKQGAGTYQYANFQINSDTTSTAGASSTSDVKIIIGPNISNDAGGNCGGEVRLYNPSTAGIYKMFEGSFTSMNTTPRAIRTVSSGFYFGDTNAINAVRFLDSAGNISSGKCELFGIRNGTA